MNRTSAYRAPRLLLVEQDVAASAPDIRENVFKAWRWAKDRLMRREGEGWSLILVRDKGGIVFSLSKPSWPGDHCGSRQPTGALAIVYAVFEYERGL